MSAICDYIPDTTLLDPDEYEDSLSWKLTSLPDQLFPNDVDTLLADSQQILHLSPLQTDAPSFQYDTPASPQPQIRYHDCMWSGRCVAHQDKKRHTIPSNVAYNRVQNRNITNTTNSDNRRILSNANSNIQNKSSNNGFTQSSVTQTKLNTQQQQNSINTTSNNNTINQKWTKHIPAGTSLLLNSRNNQQQQHKRQQTQQCKMKIPTVTASEFLQDREQTNFINSQNNLLMGNNTLIARPDTPLSLDDDATEFKHTVDLSACVMGSNHLNLDSISKVKAISILKEHLEESSTEGYGGGMTSLFSPTTTPHYSLGNCLKLGDGDGGGGGKRNSLSLSDALSVMKSVSHSKDDDDEDEIESDAFDENSDSESGNNTSSSGGSISSGIGSLVSNMSNTGIGHHTSHSDHSYTRNKNRVDLVGLGVQTPSDSEEEIDVVSIHDKTLPTNPSAKDRRALQSRLTASIVKTSKNVKTIPARRRCSEESYSSSIASPVKSNSGYGSNMVTSDYSPSISGSATNGRLASSGNMSTSGYSSAATNGRYAGNSRKRNFISSAGTSSSTTPIKRHRGKKQRLSNKRQNSDSDEADNIEKRNLHNDMERQRRIGLKNLFEELKRQIPSISDKERAPKVHILREAADLCRKLNKEQEEMKALKMQQDMLLARVRSLRTTLANKRVRCTE